MNLFEKKVLLTGPREPSADGKLQVSGPEVPLYDLQASALDMAAVCAPLERGWLTMGPEVDRFEKAFAERLGVAHVVAVANGTAALHASLLALGIGHGDEVICPSLTFVATVNAVRYVGAEVVFCDIPGPQDLNLDPQDVERRITKRTRAVIAVHYAGYPADLPRLERLCSRHGLLLIEDAAHACVSILGGRSCGSWGMCGCFSFFSNKNITCGEGGAIATNDRAIASSLRLLRSHGMTSTTVERREGRALDYDVVELGYNYRLDEIRASLLLSQLDRLEDFLSRREHAVGRYKELLGDLPVTLPEFDWAHRSSRGDRVAHHIFPVILPANVDRMRVQRKMREMGVETSVHYPPAHRLATFVTEGRTLTLPNTEAAAARQLTLPLFPSLTAAQQERVRDSLEVALEEA